MLTKFWFSNVLISFNFLKEEHHLMIIFQNNYDDSFCYQKNNITIGIKDILNRKEKNQISKC